MLIFIKPNFRRVTIFKIISDLREQRHLAYSVSSNYDFIGDSGIMTLTIGTTTENHETGEKTFDNVKNPLMVLTKISKNHNRTGDN